MNPGSVLVMAACVLACGQALAVPACAALAQLKLPSARVDSAQEVAEGTPLVLWTGAAPTPSPRVFCRVKGTATPSKGSRIGFEVWLPTPEQWNGKFLQAGSGALGGAVPLPSLLDALQRGYAAAATDTGHQSDDGLDASWAVGHPERVVDFGWRAVRHTTLAARRIDARGLGRAPGKSYFVGCSDGGRDAFMVAQRFPKAFDGIVAGAPAYDWTGLMAAQVLVQRELADPRSRLPVDKLPALQAAALAACASGSDRFVRDPLRCRFDPDVLRCADVENAQCLTPAQVSIVRRVYEGLPNPATGRRLHGLEPGAEAQPGNWDFWVLATPTNPLGKPGGTRSVGESFFRYVVRGDPAFALSDLADDDIVRAHRRWSADLDAVNPDLGAYRARGGKLLHYHGWSDAGPPPRSSIAYHDAVARRMGDPSGFYRLFMVPGMNHCAGGEGPWQVDWVGVLERWVEQGEAPSAIMARHPNDGSTQTLRPHGRH